MKEEKHIGVEKMELKMVNSSLPDIIRAAIIIEGRRDYTTPHYYFTILFAPIAICRHHRDPTLLTIVHALFIPSYCQSPNVPPHVHTQPHSDP